MKKSKIMLSKRACDFMNAKTAKLANDLYMGAPDGMLAAAVIWLVERLDESDGR